MGLIKGLNKDKIRKLYLEGYCTEEIARRFKCRSNAIVHHIYDLTLPCVNKRRKNSKLTKKQIVSIRHLFIKKKLSAPIIATKFNVSPTTILNIAHGVFYRWVPGTVIDKFGVVHIIPSDISVMSPVNTKGARQRGPNENSERMVKPGDLIPIAKKYNVSNCTISKWLRKGKIDAKGCLIT